MKNITSRIPNELYNWLKEYSVETELPMAYLIRKSLKDLYNKMNK